MSRRGLIMQKLNMEAIDSTPPAWVKWAQIACRTLPAGRYRLMHALRSQQRPPFWCVASANVGGFDFVCHLGDSIAREVCFTGRYEPQETMLLQRLLTPGATFVDVGANWGYFTLMAAAMVGSTGRVISLEPDPRLCSLLSLNLARNGFAWARLLPIAASATHGSMSLIGFNPANDNWGTSRLSGSPAASDGADFEVPVAPLDDLLDEAAIDRVDVLKMDIEGAEALAIEGMQRGLASDRYPCILLELHPTLLPEHGTTASRLVQRFLDLHYQAWRIDHSPQMSRQAAYSADLDIARFVRPLDTLRELDDWPHLLLSTGPLPFGGIAEADSSHTRVSSVAGD